MITNDYGVLVPDPLKSAHEQRIDEIEARLIFGDQRMGRLESDLSELSATSKSISENTQELVTLFDAVKGAFKVLNWIAAVAKPVTLIAVAVGTLYGLYTKITGRGS